MADGPPLGAPRVPSWVPWVVFPGLTIVLFGTFIFSDLMLYGVDTIPAGIVARDAFMDGLREVGRLPRWQPGLLGGVPFLESLSFADSLYPPTFLFLMLADLHRALGWKMVLHVALAGFFAFGWMRALGTSRAAALVSGVGYMLAPVFVSLFFAGHDGKVFVTALAPLLFWATERHFARPTLASFTAVALVVAATILTSHFQMAYFLFAAVGAFAMFRTARMWFAVRAKRRAGRALGRFGTFLAASVVGATIVSGFLLPAIDHVSNWSRRTATTDQRGGAEAVAYSSSWSIHPEEAFGLVVPEFPGANVGPDSPWAYNTYWGRNAFKLNSEYAGLVLLILSVVAFTGGTRRGTRWFLFGLGATALLFALGGNTPVWRIFYEVVPGISLFRAPSQAMYLFAFSAATLAGFGVDRLFSKLRAGGGEKVMKALLYSAGGVATVALLAQSGLLTTLWTATLYADMPDSRAPALAAAMPHIQRGAWMAFGLAASLLGAAWGFRSGILGPRGLLVAVLVLVAIDPIRVDRAFIETFDFHRWATADPNTEAILRSEAGSDEPYRLLSYKDRGNGQDVTPQLHGIDLAGGHHPNDLALYRELIGMAGSSAPLHLYQSANIRRLLNVRYVLWPDLELGGSIDTRTDDFRAAGYWPPATPGAPAEVTVFSRTQLADGRTYETVVAEPGLARARLVGGAVVKSDAEAVPHMLSADFDPSSEVVLAEQPSIPLDSAPAEGSVRWAERGVDRLVLEVRSERPALLVVADNWYPGWRAAVNGEETDVLRAYHALRAVSVPAGRVHRGDVVRVPPGEALVSDRNGRAGGARGAERAAPGPARGARGRDDDAKPPLPRGEVGDAAAEAGPHGCGDLADPARSRGQARRGVVGGLDARARRPRPADPVGGAPLRDVRHRRRNLGSHSADVRGRGDAGDPGGGGPPRRGFGPLCAGEGRAVGGAGRAGPSPGNVGHPRHHGGGHGPGRPSAGSRGRGWLGRPFVHRPPGRPRPGRGARDRGRAGGLPVLRRRRRRAPVDPAAKRPHR